MCSRVSWNMSSIVSGRDDSSRAIRLYARGPADAPPSGGASQMRPDRCRQASVSVVIRSRPIVPPTAQARSTPQRSATVPMISEPIGTMPAKTSA